MLDSIRDLSLLVVMAPLFGSIAAGVFGKQLGRKGAHTVTILGVTLAFLASVYLFKLIMLDGVPTFNEAIYTWGISGRFTFSIGFLIDHLTVLMMLTVTFISLLVHIYSIGYMHDDPGYQRFFSYISFFTFAMLTLVMANNFLQLYFGWEGVGLASYLLIGFWFKRESANQGSLKAFLVNRVGDFGFLIGIAAILAYFGSLDYATVFAEVPSLADETIEVFPHVYWSVITLTGILLFIGAMGKSAQVPLHVWLPESMEGPTPISALIHAATMVTAGIYMVSRMSPLYEYSEVALSTILIIGATGALFTGILAIVQNDIKRVVAYSTLSQLGYMVAGLGVSAFSASLFHLFTHACFKALLFLGAGSVIIALHHEQDMRKMGGLYKYMPITYATFLVGCLALVALPPFSGFYSKDIIIDAVAHASVPGASYAYFCVVAGTFVTALYTFRAFFLTFHTKERMDEETRAHLHETPAVVWLPLVILTVPSIVLGWILIEPLLFAQHTWLSGSIFVLPQHQVLMHIGEHFAGPLAMAEHAVRSLPFWLVLAGISTAWLCYVKHPHWPAVIAKRGAWFYRILVAKYGFDQFNQWFFVRGSRELARYFYKICDKKVIDEFLVEGSARVVVFGSRIARRIQSGYLYHYALIMVLGLVVLLSFVMLG